MKQVLKIAVMTLFMVLLSVYAQAEKKDCSCPKITCGPCQKKISVGKIVKFCDWGDINVCRKVICENVNFYFQCLSKNSKKRTEKSKKTASTGEIDFIYEKGRDPAAEKRKKKKGVNGAATKIKRNNKNQELLPGRIEVGNDSRVISGPGYSDKVVGQIALSSKKIHWSHRGLKTLAKKGQKLYVGDEFINLSKVKEKLSIGFTNGQVHLQLMPKSKLIVQDPDSIVGRFQPFVYLVHGGVQFKVDLKEGSFDILAGQILTRSHGGEQRVAYEMGQEGLQVKVESLQQDVEVLKAQDLSGHAIVVGEGNFISWMSETPGHLFSQDEKQALVGEGFITPVFEMSDLRRKQLGVVKNLPKPLFADWTKKTVKKKIKRGLAHVEPMDSLCQAPQASYQQCAWSCEGNSKGAKSCQAEKNKVHCVRRMCNAAGEWGVPTAFASSYADLCPAEGVRVGDCSP